MSHAVGLDASQSACVRRGFDRGIVAFQAPTRIDTPVLCWGGGWNPGDLPDLRYLRRETPLNPNGPTGVHGGA